MLAPPLARGQRAETSCDRVEPEDQCGCERRSATYLVPVREADGRAVRAPRIARPTPVPSRTIVAVGPTRGQAGKRVLGLTCWPIPIAGYEDQEAAEEGARRSPKCERDVVTTGSSLGLREDSVRANDAAVRAASGRGPTWISDSRRDRARDKPLRSLRQPFAAGSGSPASRRGGAVPPRAGIPLRHGRDAVRRSAND